jgi:hypothetical protein
MDTMWKDADPSEVRAVWADELGRYEASDIKDALDALRTSYVDWPPTLYQFSDLCAAGKKRRQQNVVRLDDRTHTEMPAAIRAQFAAFKAKHIVGDDAA